MPVYAPVFVPAALAGFCFLTSWPACRRRALATDGHLCRAPGVRRGSFACLGSLSSAAIGGWTQGVGSPSSSSR